MINIDIKFDKEYYGVYGKEFGRSIFDFQVSPKIDIEELAEGNQEITLNFFRDFFIPIFHTYNIHLRY